MRIEWAQSIELDCLEQFVRGGREGVDEVDRVATAIQALDVLVRQIGRAHV